jgi:hypothetical protein
MCEADPALGAAHIAPYEKLRCIAVALERRFPPVLRLNRLDPGDPNPAL